MLNLWQLSVFYLSTFAANCASHPNNDAGVSGVLPDPSVEATTSKSSSTSTFGTSLTLRANATCHSRTANYITHTLPQQCLRTHRSVAIDSIILSTSSYANGTSSTGYSDVIGAHTASPLAPPSEGKAGPPSDSETTVTKQGIPTVTTATFSGSSIPSVQLPEAETDSPLDNANFLSFEDWKKQNLAKAGQSPDNLARRSQSIDANRRRPGINNVLDTLGEESEIELDFSGFGGGFDSTGEQRRSGAAENAVPVASSPAQQAHRSKDAGKTCKERTNYASFDCAASVLKSNPECKSGPSVLVENKDSYMLNKCTANNKFIIVELCNDILIDTIVLANYEFFSSIFRHFRISVSDRYPVKIEKWKSLGTFEARNTREVQAFLIENPLIWARYLRIEFLTHYGNEYFCPVSLLRVHGTTMMDEFRHQEEIARGDPLDDDLLLEPEVAVEAIVTQEPSSASPEVEKETGQAMPAIHVDIARTVSSEAVSPEKLESSTLSSSAVAVNEEWTPMTKIEGANPELFMNATCAADIQDSLVASITSSEQVTGEASTMSLAIIQTTSSVPIGTGVDGSARKSGSSSPEPIDPSATGTGTGSSYSTAASAQSGGPSIGSGDTHNAAVSSSKPASSRAVAPPISRSRNETASHMANKAGSPNANSTRPVASSTSPQPAQPSTQESFFKSVHKRLQQLESNSTLSLQYIEEQSRILRDAFSKVEKRQISATTNFLTHVNETIMAELHGFRQAYDQLWQSTVIELEGQRESYQREMLALSTRLTLVADELVWQKRMGIVQSTLLLLCLGLVLFNRAGNSTLEIPLVQQMMHKSQAAFRSGFESPPNSPSPDSRSPVSLFRRKLWRYNNEPASGHATDEIDSRPPSQGGPSLNLEPPTPEAVSEDEEDDGEWKEVPEVQSGPATPSGSRNENGPPSWPDEAERPESPLQLSS